MKISYKKCLSVFLYTESSKLNSSPENIIEELNRLLDTAGYTVVDKFIFKQKEINPKTYISKGRLEAIKELAKKEGVSYIVFDNELTPSQIASIEKNSEKEDNDESKKSNNIEAKTRTDIILEIFSMRAKTNVAKKQVELARLEFEYPRLKGKWSHFSRIEGGIGVRGGSGEMQLEYDRRRARDKINKLKKELSRISKSADTGRHRRGTAFKIVVVGYTNAGKSTLFNMLCKESVYVEDRLFATLETRTRKVYLNGNEPFDVVISDTVGFIDRLPHLLVESFKSTLAEVKEADLLIHLIDSTSSNMEAMIESVEKTLKEIDASEIKTLMVFNKIDSLEREKINMLETKYNEALFISSKTAINIDKLKNKILECIDSYISKN